MREISKKRFSPSNEPFAVERRRVLQEIVLELMAQFPEVVGFTVSGSLVKTRSEEEAIRLRGSPDKARHRLDSDIDGNLFIDVDMIQNQYGDEEIVRIEHLPTAYSTVHLRKDAFERYRKPLCAKLKGLGGSSQLMVVVS